MASNDTTANDATNNDVRALLKSARAARDPNVMTYRRLRRMYRALVGDERVAGLAGRRLPTVNNDIRIARIAREHFVGHYEDIEYTLRKIRENNPAPEGLEGHQIPVAILERRTQLIDQALDEPVEGFEWPKRKITIDDLPGDLKSIEENRAALTDILIHLDALYDWPDTEIE